MKSKFFRIFHFSLIAIIIGTVIFLNKKSDEVSGHNSSTAEPAKRFPAAIPKNNRPTLKSSSRIFRGPASTPDYSKIVIANNRIKISPTIVITENIGAMPLKEWKPGMKPFLYQSGAYGFFEKTPGDPSIPAAYNSRTKRFHVVSSILQVKGVSEELRTSFKKMGYQEYIYFEKLDLLFLKSSSPEVVKLYEKLKKEGYVVKLEILKDRAQSH